MKGTHVRGSDVISFYEAVLKCDPDDIDARVRLGWLYENEVHDYDAALKHLNSALSRKPQSAEAGYWLAKVYYHHYSEYELAQTPLEQVLKFHPEHVPSLSLLASVYRCGRNEPKRAVELLQRALALAPSWISLHVNADCVYCDLDEMILAKKHAEEAARLAEVFYTVSTTETYTYYEAVITGRWVDSETVAQLRNRVLHNR